MRIGLSCPKLNVVDRSNAAAAMTNELRNIVRIVTSQMPAGVPPDD
jgi:hypothetical protein